MNAINLNISREFRQPFFKDWDRNFLFILLFSFLVEMTTVTILSRRPVPEYTEKEIARIQERFANFILDETTRREAERTASTDRDIGIPVGDETVSKEEGEETVEESKTVGEAGEGEGEGGAGEGASSAESMERRRMTRMATAESRQKSREAITREVSGKGLLGLLTGTGSAADGEAVTSLFSGSGSGVGGSSDLDEVLASVDGLQTGGSPGGSGGSGGSGVRGGRSGNRAGIDDLVSDKGSSVTSQSLSRKGELTTESVSEVEGLGRKSVYRSSEAIQEVLLSHNKAIQYCYERELKRNPALKGKVVVRITVNPEGEVVDVSIVSSTLNNERVERCILARIRLWKDFKAIDPSEGNVTFRQGYLFGY